MADLKSIPDEVKWQIAADCAARLPTMYDIAFRSVVGERYDAIEQEIWMELSRTASQIARNLSLPVDNAQDLTETLRTVMTIMFGPDYKTEALEVSEDGAVIIVRRCPLLARGNEMGGIKERTFQKCLALALTTIPLLNKKYTTRFVRTMCTGDRQCEIKVEADKQPEDTKKK
jgi:hypothetical protein